VLDQPVAGRARVVREAVDGEGEVVAGGADGLGVGVVLDAAAVPDRVVAEQQ
jgi:hypothetical protein